MYILIFFLAYIFFKNHPVNEITIGFESGVKTINSTDLAIFLNEGIIQFLFFIFIIFFIIDTVKKIKNIIKILPKSYIGYLRLKEDLFKRYKTKKDKKSNIIINP